MTISFAHAGHDGDFPDFPFGEQLAIEAADHSVVLDGAKGRHEQHRADLPAVGEAAHGVVREAKAAGVWIFGGGVMRQKSSIVATDGTITDGPEPETRPVIGGFSIIEVPSRAEALAWAARIAQACRCPQEVREIMFDPES